VAKWRGCGMSNAIMIDEPMPSFSYGVWFTSRGGKPAVRFELMVVDGQAGYVCMQSFTCSGVQFFENGVQLLCPDLFFPIMK